MINWFTTTTPGQFITTFCISAVPVIELRGGLPFGITAGLNYPLALLAAVLGNILPVPFILVYIRRFLAWVRRCVPRLNFIATKLEQKAHLKGRLVHKYSALGLCLLVAIPLPGTGAWTGALVAALLDVRLRQAVPAILLGVLAAAAIMTGMTFGVLHLT